MNPARRAAAAHARAVNRVYGEPLRLKPQGQAGRSGGVAGPDADRPVVEFSGSVSRRPVTMQRSGDGAKGGTNVQFTDAAWSIGWPAELAIVARAGDRVERLDPPPGEPVELRLHAPLSIRGRTIHPADPVTP